MGYTTDFFGKFTCTPPLNAKQVAYLELFNQTRRVKRNAVLTAIRPDPIREAVGLPVGPDGGYFVGAGGSFGQENPPQWQRSGEPCGPDITDYNSPPSGQPGLWCQWTPTEDGTAIEWDEGEKFYDYVEWIEYLIQHFLSPWGISLSGKVSWTGEDRGDLGVIYAKGYRVEAVESKIVTPAPDWEG